MKKKFSISHPYEEKRKIEDIVPFLYRDFLKSLASDSATEESPRESSDWVISKDEELQLGSNSRERVTPQSRPSPFSSWEQKIEKEDKEMKKWIIKVRFL